VRAAALATAGIGAMLGACAQMPVQETDPRPAVAMGSAPVRNLTSGCVADYRSGVDYFPAKARFTDSAQLRVDYHGNWKRVTFTPAVDTHETLTLVLVQCGTPRPKVAPRDVVVEVPLRNFATANPSMLGAAVLLGVDARLRGVPSLTSVSLPSIRERIDRREVVSVYASGHGNGEQAAALGADLFFTFYSAYPDANLHPLLKRMGVAAAPQADHTEPTPLGRAEWLKYLALFFNEEEKANEMFADRKTRYQRLAVLTRGVRHRPVVQLGYPESRGTWSQAGGRNFLYRLVEDAGGSHRWRDVEIAGSLTFAPIERVYDRAGDADFWLGSFAAGAGSLAALRAEQPRLAWMRPIRKGQVWWFDANKLGFANPWSDQGMTEPQDALAELIAVLHPELLKPPANPRFLRRIPGDGA
jgi:iron complex transport system substrate-binding protein